MLKQISYMKQIYEQGHDLTLIELDYESRIYIIIYIQQPTTPCLK